MSFRAQAAVSVLVGALIGALLAMLAGCAHAELPRPKPAPVFWTACPEWATPLPWLVIGRQHVELNGTPYYEWVFDRDRDGDSDLVAEFPTHGGQTTPYPAVVIVKHDGHVAVYADMVGFGLCKDYIEITESRDVRNR